MSVSNQLSTWRGAIGIFAKTPELSPVKTRLAKDLGQAKAITFYNHSVAATAVVIGACQQTLNSALSPYWALGEEPATNYQRWQNFNTIWTGEGGLGERLYHVYEQLWAQHDYVILMGTDCPQLSSKLIMAAIDRLTNNPNQCVIGPATDGGFYLFAAAQPLSSNTWLPVEYSTKNTLTQLTNNLQQQGIPYELLAPHNDVDTLADLIELRISLTAQEDLLPKQKQLLQWLDQTLGNSF